MYITELCNLITVYHWAEVKAKMYIMNLGKPTKVAKLNETMAIELGANLMGEVIIFSVAGGCLILEYNRQVAKEAKREEARFQQIEKFTNEIDNLNQITSNQESTIQYLQEAVNELAKHTKHELITKLRVKESSEQMPLYDDDNENTNDDPKTRTSLIERAIVYYKNNVKAEKLS